MVNESKYQLFIEQIEKYVQSPNKLVMEAFNSEYAFIELNSLLNEVCLCIFCGLPQASITLTNTLLELAMRISIQYAKGIGIEINNNLLEPLKYEKKNGKKIPQNSLSNNIKIAFAMGLITHEQKDFLNKYRKDFRNNFSHARLETIEEEKIPIGSINISEKRCSQIENSLSEFLPLYGISLYMSAENSYIKNFLDIDKIIRSIICKINQYGK